MFSLFNAATVAELGEPVARAKQDAGGTAGQEPAETDIIPHASRAGELPLAIPQEQIWFIEQLYPGIMPYSFQSTLRLKGPLNISALERSLSEIVRRHEIYRTAFGDSGGKAVQIIHEPWSVQLPVVDLQATPEADRDPVVQRWLRVAFSNSFDITQLPLLRWTLLRLGPHDHILVHVEHHLVHDGWSFNVFLRELLTLYKAFSEGNPSPLPELPIQFADYAAWQQQWVRGAEARSQLHYWRERLAGSPPLLELPTDRPRPALPSFRGAAPRIELPPDLSEALRALSRREGVTLFMTMLTAFLMLLERYTGQTDINVGTGVANRRRRELEGLIGMLVNIVVLPNDLSGNPTFRELLRQVRLVTLDAYAHQELPFEQIVEALQPERNPSCNPLFQVAFSFHDSPMPELEIEGLNVDVVEALSNGSAKFDLNIIVIPRAEQRVGKRYRGGAAGITLIWEYSTDLFDAATMERMVQHYRRVLESIVANPDQTLASVPLLTPEEQQQVLTEWNDTRADYPDHSCVQKLFQAQAAHTPDALAVAFGDQVLTYRELDRRANQLARHLRRWGVGAETPVGLSLERSPERIVGILGILKAGGAYVPLDPNYPTERLAFMLQDTRMPMILTRESLVGALPMHEAQAVCLDSDWAEIAREANTPLPNLTRADGVADIMYTSGSTGRPKGILIPHRGITRLVCNTDDTQMDASDRFTQMASASFDAFTFELWGALLHGAQLIGVAKEIALSPLALAEFLEEQQGSVVFLTTALFNQIAHEAPWAFGGVRDVMFGGEAADPQSVRQVLAHNPPAHLLNLYGPTENTSLTTWHRATNVVTHHDRGVETNPIQFDHIEMYPLARLEATGHR